jgi:hypothetical protein
LYIIMGRIFIKSFIKFDYHNKAMSNQAKIRLEWIPGACRRQGEDKNARPPRKSGTEKEGVNMVVKKNVNRAGRKAFNITKR